MVVASNAQDLKDMLRGNPDVTLRLRQESDADNDTDVRAYFDGDYVVFENVVGNNVRIWVPNDSAIQMELNSATQIVRER